MSEHGWREFHAAEGVDDWVVLHGGAAAVFGVASLGDAPVADDNAIDPLGHGSTVWMQDLNPDKPLRHADRAGNGVCICAWPDGSTLSAPVDPQHDA